MRDKRITDIENRIYPVKCAVITAPHATAQIERIVGQNMGMMGYHAECMRYANDWVHAVVSGTAISKFQIWRTGGKLWCSRLTSSKVVRAVDAEVGTIATMLPRTGQKPDKNRMTETLPMLPHA